MGIKVKFEHIAFNDLTGRLYALDIAGDIWECWPSEKPFWKKLEAPDMEIHVHSDEMTHTKPPSDQF